ncbi:MAG: MaoC/PaaZ C-terminal domain-containing protein [Myxococcota bacterium]|nr:MaoC/PaaZ C-terminal domain-containing protein [Myxococcota bacterium]
MMTETRNYTDVQLGESLPGLSVDLTVSLIVAGAVASQDYTPVHHDKKAAQEAGMQDVFMNILTTNGLVSRFVTDWAGIDSRVTNVAIKLGTPNLPGDTMELSGEVTAMDEASGSVTLSVTGKNAWGNHVTGTVDLLLPKGAH